MKYKNCAVYILANNNNTTLYIGVTSNLIRRIYEHKSKCVEGFSKKYNLTKLVYFQLTDSINAAINYEKRLKAGSRQAKITLIEKHNPGWKDLYEDII